MIMRVAQPGKTMPYTAGRGALSPSVNTVTACACR
jgi:hypothetical protein